MSLKGLRILYLTAFALLSGCKIGDVTSQPEFIGTQDRWDKIDAKSLQAKYTGFGDVRTNATYKAYVEATGDPKKLMRNEIVKDLLWLTDYGYNAHRRSLVHGDQAFNFSMDLATLILTTSAAVVGGEEAKTVLSAIAAVTTGTKTAYSATFLREKTMNTIIAKMDTARAKRKISIIDRLVKSDAEYPLREALTDVLAYLDDGTMVSSLIALEAEQNKQKIETEADLEKKKTGPLPPPASPG